MSGEQTELNITLIVIVVVVGLIAFLWRQQKTIDKLSDKLMGIQQAPKRPEPIKEDDVSPTKENEPISWHDN